MATMFKSETLHKLNVDVVSPPKCECDPPLKTALYELEKALYAHKERMSELCSRLEPVMRQMPSAVGLVPASPVQEATSEVVRMVRNQTCNLITLSDEVSEVLCRLDV